MIIWNEWPFTLTLKFAFFKRLSFPWSAAISVEPTPCNGCGNPSGKCWTTFQLRSPNSCRVACTLLDHMAEKCEKPTAEPDHLEEKKVFSCDCLRRFFHLASEFLNHRIFAPIWISHWTYYGFQLNPHLAPDRPIEDTGTQSSRKRCVAQIPPRSFSEFFSRSNAGNEMGCNKNCKTLF